MTARDTLIADTFVELADTLVTGFDVVDFLHTLVDRAVELLGADAGGIMLADQRGGLEVLAASDHATHLLELFELQHEEGPCMDAFRTGQQVVVPGVREMLASWPRFTPRLQAAGFSSAQAIPMRLRTEVIGALNLFRAAPVPLSEVDVRLARAMADVATVGLLQARAIAARDELAEQLQGALNTRVMIEQAKGIIAERTGVDVAEAFVVLRTHARRTGTSLSQLAAAVIAGRVLPSVTALRQGMPPEAR